MRILGLDYVGWILDIWYVVLISKFWLLIGFGAFDVRWALVWWVDGDCDCLWVV